MDEIRTLRHRSGVTQAGLAKAAGTSQSAVAAYEVGRKSPTMRTVRRLAKAVGMEATVEFHPPLTREDRRSLWLHRAIARRLLEDPGPILDRARANVARMMEQHSAGNQLLREWRVILDRSVEDLVALLSDPDPYARELRHVSPFGGVLSARERAETYRAFAETEGGSA